MKRYLEEDLRRDLEKKMVFLSGPRQCGKTTISKQIMESFPGSLYLNWDRAKDRRSILREELDEGSPLVVFNEIHKYRPWKNKIKGLFDTKSIGQRFLVTGSARLDVYRRGGDSLMGRYHHWRLHPITPDETVAGLSAQQVVDRLMTLGGFPEPFLGNNERETRRWRRERWDKVLKEDIRDLEAIRDLSSLTLLLDLLRERVGSPVVINNLVDDLQASHKTIQNWIDVLERMYVIFRVYPMVGKVSRSLKKPPKIFFYDVADVQADNGARPENLLACALLKRVHYLSDRDGFRYSLTYLRDKEKREVDFAIVRDDEVLDLIECKYSPEDSNPSLLHFSKKLGIKNIWQLTVTPQRPKILRGVTHSSIAEVLSSAPIETMPEECESLLKTNSP